MSPSIPISDETFSKLQALAKPFVDTPESVIAALADSELERRAISPNGDQRGPSGRERVAELDPDAPESLTHTRLLSATVDGQSLHRPKWNGLQDHLHVKARARMGSFQAVSQASAANVREGKYVDNGYRHLPDADLSVQGVDANLAWSHSLRLARALGVPIDVKFEWRMKEGAARPGETAVLRWEPVPSASKAS